MKKIIILILIILSIALIYRYTNRKDFLVFSIGNDEGDISYKPENARVTDIIIDIVANREIEDRKIQNILVKAKEVIIDLNNFVILNSHVGLITQLNDLKEVFTLLRKYNKEKITVILLDEQSELAEYANKKITLLSKKYGIEVIRNEEK